MSMNNHELLQEIYYQNKSLNRTAQRISLIGLLGLSEELQKTVQKEKTRQGKKW